MYHRILIFYNPSAGVRRPRLREDVVAAFSRYAAEVTLRETSAAGDYGDVVWGSYDLVCVCGGDGTVNAITRALVSSSVLIPVAIIPTGSANLLASYLGIPKDVPGAVGLAMTGLGRALDVLMVNNAYPCVIAMGIGYDAFVMRATAQKHKQRLGIWTYFFYLVAGLLHWHETNYSLLVDGKRFQRHAKSLFVMNVGNFFGIDFGPNVAPDDGKIDLAVVRPISFRDIFKLSFGLLSKKYSIKGRLEYLSGTRVQIHYDTRVPLHIDGEVVELKSPLELTLLPHRLSVVGEKQKP